MSAIAPPLPEVGDPLLEIHSLAVEFAASDRPVQAVNDVTLSLWRGETLGIIGESGSGKSALAMSILRLLPSPPARVVAGRILLDGENLLTADSRRLRDIRGRRVSMVFQDPGTSLHPSYTIGRSACMTVKCHRAQPGNGARNCSTASESAMPRGAWTSTRTSSQAGCGNAS